MRRRGRGRFHLPRRPAAALTAYTTEEVAAVVEACPAIEVVTNPSTPTPTPLTPIDKLADCISNGAFVHGPIFYNNGKDLALGKLKVTLAVNGEPVLQQVGGHPTGDPLGIAVALVEMMPRCRWREEPASSSPAGLAPGCAT